MILTLDIETLPATSERVAKRIADKIKPPGTLKKAESIQKWIDEEKESAIQEAIAKTGLNGLYGSVLCIGYKIDDKPADCILGESEADTLHEFNLLMQSFKTFDVHPLTVAGHNLVNFDLRFLYQRYCVNGMKKPPHIPFHAKPWDATVFDTMVKWAGAGNFVSLDDLCFAFDLEGKGDMDGSKVAQYYAEGRIAEIARYCKDDVEKTYNVFQRMK
jgi:hypothetical protein